MGIGENALYLQAETKEFKEVIWELYLLEVLWRAKGNPLEADRLMKLRVRLKHSAGIESTYKDEENHQ